MQSIDRVGTGVTEFVAVIDQQPQRHGRVVGPDRAQLGCAQANQGHGVGIDRVGLAALTSGEHAYLGRERGWDIPHGLAVGDQSLREVSARRRRSPRSPRHARDVSGLPPASVGSRPGRWETGQHPGCARGCR